MKYDQNYRGDAIHIDLTSLIGAKLYRNGHIQL